jgi:O-antigen/teichoic acid export membrane protein
VAGAGVVALASTVIQFADRVDAIVTGTLYPAICRVADRTDVLFESFVKSNRLALMWAMPFGVGLALFAEDLVRFGIGDRWTDAIPLLQAFGLIAAVNHLGFNWTAYFRARADTRPIAVTSGITTVAFVLITLPLLIFGGLEGFAYGMAAMMLVQLGCRVFYLRRLFEGFRLLPHAVRAVTPVLPGAAAVLVVRALDPGRHSGLVAAGQLALFAAVVLVCTIVAERALLREALGYLRGTSSTPSAAPAA